MKVEFVHRIERLQAVGDRVLHVRDLNLKRTERVVAAGVRRSMLPDTADHARVILGPRVGGFRVGQGGMPRAIGEVNDRQPAAVREIAGEI